MRLWFGGKKNGCKKYEGECICDLEKHAIARSDWAIARLVGAATYAQLLDAAPGLFEPFEDWRSDGGSANSLHRFIPTIFGASKKKLVEENTPAADAVPYPPNLVSTVLGNGDLSAPQLKRLLIKAALGKGLDPRIEPLVATSIMYSYPVSTLGEIFFIFVLLAVLFSIVLGIAMQYGKKHWCSGVGGCRPTCRFAKDFLNQPC